MIEGALTDADAELLWLVFGNPTHTSDRFRECFAGGRFAHRWSPRQIDSRSIAMTTQAPIAAWVKDHGEDSDFIRACARACAASSRAFAYPVAKRDWAEERRFDEALTRLKRWVA